MLCLLSLAVLFTLCIGCYGNMLIHVVNALLFVLFYLFLLFARYGTDRMGGKRRSFTLTDIAIVYESLLVLLPHFRDTAVVRGSSIDTRYSQSPFY